MSVACSGSRVGRGEARVSENAARARPAPPRLALTPAEAAAAIGISEDSFNRHVRDELRLVRRGRLVLVPIGELTRWLERSAALTLEVER